MFPAKALVAPNSATPAKRVENFLFIILNLILIYYLSYIGASISTVSTEFLILVLMLYALSKTEFKLNLKKSVLPSIQVILANIIMGVVLLYLNLPFIFAIVVAVIVYIVALIVTGAINRNDISIVLNFINDFKK